METDIYKSKSNPNTYLFVRSGRSTTELPSALLEKLGTLEFLKSITVIPGLPLIAANPLEVIKNIKEHGYHVQWANVSVKSDVSGVGAAVGGGILALSLGLGPIGAIVGAVLGAWLASEDSDAEEDK